MPRLRDGVIQRGGSWSYVIRVPDPATGVSKPKWVGGFATEEDAKAARDEARVRARRGEYVNRSTSTVAAYLAEWVEAHASTVKPKTLAGYRHDIDHYIVPRIGRMRLQALRPAVISKLYRDLAEHGGRDGQPLAATTVSHIHRTLRKALADAVQVEQLLAVNPAARSKRPRSHAAEPTRVWTAEQLARLPYRRPVTPAVRLLPPRRLHRRTPRRTALPALACHRPRRGRDHLRRLDCRRRGQRVEGTTKGGRSRTVSIDSETVAILREHRRQQAAERLAAGSAWNDTGGLVFTSRWGEPLYPDTVSALMTKLINAHNRSVAPPAEPLPHARLHDLRHLHATTLLLAGVPVHVVAARLGHADPAVTLRVYSHVLREHAAVSGTSSPKPSRSSVRQIRKPYRQRLDQ